MLGNLVENAAKYGGGRSVRDGRAERRTTSTSWLRMTGRGSRTERVGELFTRGARLDTTGKPGTGLGLAIVRDVAEIYGGFVRGDRGKRRPGRSTGAADTAGRLRGATVPFVESRVAKAKVGLLGSTPKQFRVENFYAFPLHASCRRIGCRSARRRCSRRGPRYGNLGRRQPRTWTRQCEAGRRFFAFAEGAGCKHPIRPDKTRAGYNYDLPDETERSAPDGRGCGRRSPTDPIVRQIGDYYGAWMDEAGIERAGSRRLQPYLAHIAAVGDKTSWSR